MFGEDDKKLFCFNKPQSNPGRPFHNRHLMAFNLFCGNTEHKFVYFITVLNKHIRKTFGLYRTKTHSGVRAQRLMEVCA